MKLLLLSLMLRVAPLYLKKWKTLQRIRESTTTLKSDHSLVSNRKAIKKKSFICYSQWTHQTTLYKHQARALCPQTFWHYWLSLTWYTEPLTLLTDLDIIYLPAIRRQQNTHAFMCACARAERERERYRGCFGFWYIYIFFPKIYEYIYHIFYIHQNSCLISPVDS